MQCIACSSEHFMVPRKWQKVLPVGHNALQSNLGWVNVGFLIFRHKKSSKTCSKQADGILKNPKNPMLKNLVSFQIMQNQSQFKTRNATRVDPSSAVYKCKVKNPLCRKTAEMQQKCMFSDPKELNCTTMSQIFGKYVFG